ncbi:MAG: hypothetical protein JJU36_08685 [Phycisphaeraceae bacterium]|nr:hypothetical protein [Phycisphaeraceae bacterium]
MDRYTASVIRRSNGSRAVLALALGAAVLWPGAAGAVPYQGLRPVDQAVEDSDPLARGMRIPSVGLRTDGEQTSLFRLDDTVDGQPVYYRFGPGFRARVREMDYLVPVMRRGNRYYLESNRTPARDGWFLEVPPMDVVYELGTGDLGARAPARPPEDDLPAMPKGFSNDSMGVPPSMISQHRIVHPQRAREHAQRVREETGVERPVGVKQDFDDQTLAIVKLELPTWTLPPDGQFEDDVPIAVEGPIRVPLNYRIDGSMDEDYHISMPSQ